MSETLAKLKELTSMLSERDLELEKERESLKYKNIEHEIVIQQLNAVLSDLQVHILKLERSREELAIERENFRQLFNKMLDMVFVIGFDDRIITINDAVRTRLGYPNGDLVGQDISTLYDVNECNISDSGNCPTHLIAKSGERVLVETKNVRGMWNGIDVIFCVSRERGLS